MLRILLVEDLEDQRNLYRECLADAGFEVDTAGNGAEALAQFKAHKPDAVVLDIQMPGMDGIEALSKLLACDKNTVVIFHSAYPTFKGNFMTWAADAFVVKTGNPEEMVKEVQRVLTDRGLRAPANTEAAATDAPGASF